LQHFDAVVDNMILFSNMFFLDVACIILFPAGGFYIYATSCQKPHSDAVFCGHHKKCMSGRKMMQNLSRKIMLLTRDRDAFFAKICYQHHEVQNSIRLPNGASPFKLFF